MTGCRDVILSETLPACKPSISLVRKVSTDLETSIGQENRHMTMCLYIELASYVTYDDYSMHANGLNS